MVVYGVASPLAERALFSSVFKEVASTAAVVDCVSQRPLKVYRRRRGLCFLSKEHSKALFYRDVFFFPAFGFEVERRCLKDSVWSNDKVFNLRGVLFVCLWVVAKEFDELGIKKSYIQAFLLDLFAEDFSALCDVFVDVL